MTDKNVSEGKLTIEEVATFCKKKGFVYPSSEIYGGMSGFFDFGPLGVELFNNLKFSWWHHFVQSKDNVVGMEASIISHPKTWIASGHVSGFGDVMVECKKCNERMRADHLIEEELKIKAEGLSSEDFDKLIKDNNLKCTKCSSPELGSAKSFNLLFKTFVGPVEGDKSVAYMRGETAQGMFMDFKAITDTTRQKLPFGIAQIGRCFRNEISPRDFLFRSREFHIGEIEFFIHPDETKCPVLTDKHKSLSIKLLDAKTQETGKENLTEIKMGQMLKEKKLGEWHAYWLAEQNIWLRKIGLSDENLKIREHMKQELSHYSSATFDFDYTYPFGSKEIAGNANRGQYDLTQHMDASKEKLHVYDEENKKHVMPRVIEPTFGMERVFLAVIVEAYDDDKERGNVVLHLDPALAPIKVAVLPLMNKLDAQTREVYDALKEKFACFYDKSGSVGRRYARMDEVGTPYCITFDFDSIENGDVTVRDRETTKQVRVKIADLPDILARLINNTVDFNSLG